MLSLINRFLKRFGYFVGKINTKRGNRRSLEEIKKNQKASKARRRENRKRVARELIQKTKANGFCKDCGSKDDLTFHHRNPAEKRATVSKLVAWGPHRVREEIAKCDLYCRKCHDKIHGMCAI